VFGQHLRRLLHAPAPSGDTLRNDDREPAHTVIPSPRRLHLPTTFHWTGTRSGSAVSVPKLPRLAALRVLEVNAQHHLVTRVALPVLLVVGVVALGYLAYRYTTNDARTVVGGIGISTRAADATKPLAVPSDNAASPAIQGRIRTTGSNESEHPTDVPGDSPTPAPTPPVPRSEATATSR